MVYVIDHFRPPRFQEVLMAQSNEFEKIGFIGLGAMGKPMVTHLANKLPSKSRIWVYDVVESVVADLCIEFPERVLKGANAKDVAKQAVSETYTSKTPALTITRTQS
jgi:ornithine cyclodeaminase/alanine dehydrogenase-like protein (mu-crystallin family)